MLKKDGERVFNVGIDDFVVSTLPLSHATKLLSKSLLSHLPALAEDVIGLNDLLLVFLNVDRPSLIDESWLFIPDPEIIFHRISEQESFDPEMTPNGSIVCCEMMSSLSRPLANQSDEELCKAATQGLENMGYSGFKILTSGSFACPKAILFSIEGLRRGFQRLFKHLMSLKTSEL